MSDQQPRFAPPCPRCGSTRVAEHLIAYADGAMPSVRCLECGYLDLQRLPTYISPQATQKVDDEHRRLPVGQVLDIAQQAGVVDAEHAAPTTAAASAAHS